MNEQPNTKHGRLLEAVHISGYSFERACSELEWLLTDDRWEELGFKDGSAFVRSVESAFSEFRMSVEQRQPLTKKLAEIASQRAVADALGVDESTVREDLKVEGAGNPAENGGEPQKNNDPEDADAGNPAQPHVSKNSGQNEWYTPPEFLEAARRVMGSIDLDPASSEIANQTVQAVKFYTVEDDGLAQPWHGNVWLNPPYSQPLVDEFATALITRWKASEISQACVLVNNATDTQWFQRLAKRSSFICFPTKRVKFLDPEGNPTGSPLQGQSVLYFGQNGEAFSQEFRQIGMITKIVKLS